MPVAVVALAAYSFVGAAAAATAVGATMATMVAAGAVMAGSALTVVGTITGNPKLTKIGAIVGLVGGVASLANSAMSAGEAAGSATSNVASDAPSTAASAATDAATNAAGDLAGSAVQTMPVTPPGTVEPMGMLDAGASGPVIQPVANAGGAGAGAAPSASAPAASGGMLDAAVPAQSATPYDAQAARSTFDSTQTAVGKSASLDAFQTNTGSALDSFTPGASKVDAFGGLASAGNGLTDPSKLAELQNWVKQNPEMAKVAAGMVQGAAGALVPTPRDKAMMAYYNQQSAVQKAQTDAQIAAMNRKVLWGSGRTSGPIPSSGTV